MTTFDYNDLSVPLPGRQGLAAKLRDWLGARRRRRRQDELLLTRLSQFDTHMLRDIGINPQDVRDALANRRDSILFAPVRSDNRE